MKKITIAVVAAIFLVSCGGGTKKSPDGTVEVSSKNDAGAIINYYNSSIGFFKDYKNPDKVDDVIEYMDEVIKSKGSRRAHAPVVVDVSNIPSRKKDRDAVMSPGAYFDNDDRKILENNFKTYVESIDKVFENFATFKAYIQSEDYKDDDWAKGIALRDECSQCYETMITNKSEVYKVLSPLADAAEVLLLEDNPAREHILLAKTIFSNMDGILDEYSEESVDGTKIEELYSILEKNVEKARALSAVEDKAEHNMKWYGEFLNEVDSFLGEVRKAKRENKYTERGYKDLEREYRDAISDYNSFVN